MRDGSTYLDTPRLFDGMDVGGGYVCMLDITDNGYLAIRTDTQTGYLRGPTDGAWVEAFRFGINIAASEWNPKNFRADQVYEIVQAPSDHERLYSSAYGKMYRKLTRAGMWELCTGFKGGVFDDTATFMTYDGLGGGGRIGNKHMAVDPIDKNIVYFGHPIDGIYGSSDGGVTWSGPYAGTVPINPVGKQLGINIAIDRTTSNGSQCLTVVAAIHGVGVVRMTTGFGGSWSAVGTGSPTVCGGLDAKGGRIFVCGDGEGNDTDLTMWNGSAWIEPVDNDTGSVAGAQVSCRQSTNEVLLYTVGGGSQYSTDSGDTWTRYWYDLPFETDGAEGPWLATTENNYMALGGMRWHPTLDRICATNGLGYFEWDDAPRTTPGLWRDMSAGIKQLLILDLKVLPTKILFTAQDRPVVRADKIDPTVSSPMTGHGPDYTIAIRHGTNVDTAADDDDYVVMVQTQDFAKAMCISTEGGADDSWVAAPSWPVRAGFSGVSEVLLGGSIAVGTVGNIIWAPTNKNRLVGTLDGGVNWFDPVFRDELNNVLDMSGIVWSHAYFSRRIVVVNEKHNPDIFICYAWGEGDETREKAGIYKSVDKGQNWVRTWNGPIPGENYFSGLLRKVPGFDGHMFFSNGQIVVHNGALAPDGLYFSSGYGAGLTAVPGFKEAVDIGIGKAKLGSSYPTLRVDGFRDVSGTWTHGIWESTNFDPANLATATWTKHADYTNGRPAPGLIVGDMNRYGDFYVAPFSGGFFYDKLDYKLRINPT